MSETSLNIYRRPDGYYLVVLAQTTVGLWVYVAEPPVVLGTTADAAHLGREAFDRLAEPRPRTPHPKRDEWTQVRREISRPIMRSAGVRSWKAFETTAELVSVTRTGTTFTVTPMRRVAPPDRGFEDDMGAEQTLRSPSPETVGAAILQAFAPGIPT